MPMIDAPATPGYNARHAIVGAVGRMLDNRSAMRRLFSLVMIVCLIGSSLINQPYQTRAADDATPAPLSATPFGVNSHLATRLTDLPNIDIPAELIAKSGAGWAREDIHWYRIQPTPDTWDWEFTDQAMRALVTRGIKVVGVLGHPPGWATPDPYDANGSFSFSAPDVEQFAAFSQAVAVRYSRYVTHWEIWNEPDNPAFWKPIPDPAAYTRLLMRTAAAIRSSVPDARIIIGGTNPFDTHFLRTVAEAGGWPSFDILAIHPYINPASPESGNLVAAAESVQALNNQYGDRPIWVTEVGWASRADARLPGPTDEQSQANYLVRATILLWRAGVEQIFWYTLKDDPEGDTYGLFALGSGRSDFSLPKPSYAAFQTLNRQLGGAQYDGIRDLFERTTVLDFEQFGVWVRGDQDNGRLSPTDALQHGGRGAALLSYRFPTRGNDYVVFRRAPAAIIPGSPYALGVWVYGDGSGHTLKLWVRDSEGEVLQYTLGPVGPANWRFMQAPLGGSVPSWDRITQGGNGKLDFPARVEGIILDDAPDTVMSAGVIYLDDIVAVSGPEAYDLRLTRGNEAIDVLWSPQPVLVSIASRSSSAIITDRNGQQRAVAVANGRIVLPIGPAPVFVRHVR